MKAFRILVAVVAATSAAALGVALAPSASAAAGDSHIFMATSTEVHNSVRLADGTFFRAASPLGRTAGPLPSTGGFPRISSVTVGNTVHVVVAKAGSTLLHTMRRSDGTWTPYATVPTDGVGLISKVVAANVGGQLHVVLGGGLWHAVRSSAGTWTSFFDIEDGAGLIDDWDTSIADIAAAGTILGRMELVIQADDALYHTTRRSNGTWDPWDKVSDNTGNAGHMFKSSSLSLVPVGNDVHMITEGTGAPFHAVRSPDGSWTRFANVYDQTGGNPTGGTIIRLTSAPMSNGRVLLALHTGATPNLSELVLYTIRQADGSWTPFQQIPGPPGEPVQSIAAASE
jgi:hypothetical protein